MQTRDVVGFVLVPLVMLLAVLISDTRLFDRHFGPPAFVWLLRQLAYSLLVVGGTALLCQCPPAQIPLRAIKIVWTTLSLLMVGKLLLDFAAPFADSPPIGNLIRREMEEGFFFQLLNLIPSLMVLLGAFLVPRLGRARNSSSGEISQVVYVEDR